MWRIALGVLFVAHGLLTILIWSPRPSSRAPMDTSRSWLLGNARTASLVLALTAGPLIAAAGVGLLSHQAWWSLAGLTGGALSLALFGLFFTPGGWQRSLSAPVWSSPPSARESRPRKSRSDHWRNDAGCLSLLHDSSARTSTGYSA
jgi:hypothetical protein